MGNNQYLNSWKEEELKFIINNYKDMSFKEMAEELNRTANAVKIKLNRMGYKKSKYMYDKHYFDIINTEEKAYWLGFIYADGYVIKNTEVGNYEFGIELKASDYEHLKKFNKSICGNVEVKFRKRISNQNGKENESCLIRFYSVELVNSLISHGVLPNKSKIITFPKIDKSLVRHFIRGFFDGDGCIQLNKKINMMQGDMISNSKIFLEKIQALLYELNIYSYLGKDGNCARLFIKGLRNTDIFFKYIYDDCNIYLDRKFKKYHTLLISTNTKSRIKIDNAKLQVASSSRNA